MKKSVRRRLWFYGGFLAATLGGYLYQPVRIDLFPRPVPAPNPAVDPEVKRLFSKGARAAVLTAHPDDSEYYAGALLAKLHKAGAKVTLVVLTDGDKGFYPWVDAAAYGRVRKREQSEAAYRWGAEKVVFLGFPDGRLRADDAAVSAASVALKGAEWVVSFDGDYPPKVAHGDHRTAGQVAERAAPLAGARWLVRFSTHAPNGTFDLTGFDDEHRALLDAHKSQFSGEKETRVWGTIFEAGLTDGERIGVEYALAFRASRL
ncbi:PIG-L family deacetylase [bacterium]|nr:MAG: PIG-L family deacetylase [bacterium]